MKKILQIKKRLVNTNNDKDCVKKLFDELAPRYKERNGGYTRIIKKENRRGDDALVVILELV